MSHFPKKSTSLDNTISFIKKKALSVENLKKIQFSIVLVKKFLIGIVIFLGLIFSIEGCKKRKEITPNTLVVVMDAPPKGLDPRYATSDGSAKLVGLIHAGLVSVDNDKGLPMLELAESINQTNPTTYDVVLKADLTFHDGSPLTSEDVKFTLTTLGNKEIGSPYAAISRRISDFKIIDARHFIITIDAPHAPFITDLALGIVSKKLCEGRKICIGDKESGGTIGAGPFKFESREKDDVTLSAFDGYVGGSPKIKHLLFKVIKDDNTRLISLLGNTIDIAQNSVAPLMLPVVEKSEKLNIVSEPSFRYTYIAFNLDHPILKNILVRKAIAYAINRKEIIKYKFRGHATLSSGMLAPNHWAYNENVIKYDYDPEKAKKLLDEAGFIDPDGDQPLPRFSLEFKVSASKFRKSLALLIAHQLAQVGIKVTVQAFEWGTFYGDITSRNFEMTTMQWPSVFEPSLYRWVFHSSNIPTADNRRAGANRGGYRNSRVDELLDLGVVETDREKRKNIYGEVQKILADELPYISLWHEDNIAITKKRVRGYRITPNARFEYLKDSWIDF